MNNYPNPSTSRSECPKRYGYILHLWNRSGFWRASLENMETGKRSGFENLEQLFTYLMDLTEGDLQEEKPETSRVNQPETEITSCGCASADSTKTQ